MFFASSRIIYDMSDIVLQYAGKRPAADILANTERASLRSLRGKGADNKLIHGDNLRVLRALLDDYRGRVDLIYIDPPFATNERFRLGADRANTISKSSSDAIAYSDTLLGADYLEFLRTRLIFLRELLAEHGSIYLHIDYKIGHYVKVLMDEIFAPNGAKNFRNDIARIKCNPKNFRRKAYGNIKDLILFYSKSDSLTWNDPRLPFSAEDKLRLFGKKDAGGRMYTTIPLHAPGETANGSTGRAWRGMMPPKGRHWLTEPKVLEQWDAQGLVEWSANGIPRKKIFADESDGKRVQDIWEFKDPQHPTYPTQKSLYLMKFIVESSSNEGDLVLDCFCGSGTTLLAAQSLNRRWIGIDSSDAAIDVTQNRLADLPSDMFTPNTAYELLKAV